ncbi:YdbH domain-containing protein [Stakelama sp. CBK3Z-3]|uniref:YdbH domain-containing protein n=1 Tax=Stakelama flava TaxID=2860338 RepID=A0ABS6XNP8_9SPHN|nr:YdbH domain-containing protein [Stakelama flava]
MSAQSETEPDAGQGRRVPRMPRFARVLAIIAVVVATALAILWLQRKPIANSFVRDELRKRGVQARYDIADLGVSRQRLENVVIGDPDSPDLVADWVELYTDLSFSGAQVTGVSAGHVRIRGKLVDGKLSLGSIDRLLPASSGKPFSLPALSVDVADARMRLETPYGLVGLKMAGQGKLNDGFTGRLAAVSPRLAVGDCEAQRIAVAVKLSVADDRPSFAGPVRAGRAQCGDITASGLASGIDATLGERLDRWKGQATVKLDQVAAPQGSVSGFGGTVTFDGGPQRTEGTAELQSADFESPSLSGAGAKLDGRYRLGSAGNRFAGSVSVQQANLSRALLARADALGTTASGTPVAPLLARLGHSLALAGRKADMAGDLVVEQSGKNGFLILHRSSLHAASGADATLSGGEGVRYRWSDGAMTLNGLVSTSGGGLPDAAVRLSQRAPYTPVTGTAVIAPYRAGDARIDLTPVRFSAAPDGSTRLSTRLTLSGPLGDGRVDRLSLPLDADWDGGTRLTVNRACVPAGFDRLAISGLVLDSARVRLCPNGDALVRLAGAKLSGGARIAAPQLTGRIGGTPLTLAAGNTEFRLTDTGFALADVKARLGSEASMTRIDAATITGRVNGSVVAGGFTGGAGQIGNVPLAMSDAAGDWRLENGTLTLDGGLTVSDTAASPRFKPLASDDFHLTLAGSDIIAGGTLKTPDTDVKVTDVTLTHDLNSGAGHADLAMPGITFAPDALQPTDLTNLALGVVANVDGTLTGMGHIAWGREGVTSTGDFHTAGTDLAAAFGTVSGLSTDLHFTDLLGLVSAPDQVATVAEINPGIVARDGEFHYKLLGEQQVRIDSGHWPFAGGDLTLDTTVLDFGGEKDKRLTFHVKAMEADQFLQQFDFDNLNATGTFDGVLPMIFDTEGGRIEGGHLDSRKGGSLAYVGEIGQKDLGYWGNVAFQALRSLRYDELSIDMNGPLAGDMITQIRFSGVKQGEGAKHNFLTDRIAKLPFLFNIRIKAPFRQLIDSVQSYYDPSRLIERNLPTLLEQQNDAAGDAKTENGGDAESEAGARTNVQAGESRDMQ